jgi:hypothetical protein
MPGGIGLRSATTIETCYSASVSSSCDEDRMKRRDFMTLVGGAVAALPLAALAQKAGRTYRLACLSPHPRDIPFNVRFFDKLRRAGFIEGPKPHD